MSKLRKVREAWLSARVAVSDGSAGERLGSCCELAVAFLDEGKPYPHVPSSSLTLGSGGL